MTDQQNGSQSDNMIRLIDDMQATRVKLQAHSKKLQAEHDAFLIANPEFIDESDKNIRSERPEKHSKSATAFGAHDSPAIQQKPGEKKRVKKELEKRGSVSSGKNIMADVSGECKGFKLRYHMDGLAKFQNETKSALLTAYDNPFRHAMIPDEPVQATIAQTNHMREKLAECNMSFFTQNFAKCFSCWHKLTYHADSTENFDHFRFLLFMNFHENMYEKPHSSQPCDHCKGALPLGLSRISGKQLYPEK